jgi:hypothetical protein
VNKNPTLPNLIGVRPTEETPLADSIAAGFVYSTDAVGETWPENLWASCFADDGSVVDPQLVAGGLNQLFRAHAESGIAAERFALDQTTLVVTANEDVHLKFSLGGLRHSGAPDTQAFQASSLEVREVLIAVVASS